MGERFDELYQRRRGVYAKDASDETFLQELNEDLHRRELALYGDFEIRHPLLFVVGLPRSGTTLLSQLLAYCLDVGYVNNVAARFWLAPVHGLRLARIVTGKAEPPGFESDYARTGSLLGIHEFGYFWRHWLRKRSFADVASAREREDEIDWAGLRRTLANVQHEFDRPLVAKNMLGAYHMPRLSRELGPVLWIRIERDPLDVAVSILDARRNYYTDVNTWWSYVPVEYPLLRDRDHWHQIAGQVHYLERLYERAARELPEGSMLRVTYERLAREPAAVLEDVRRATGSLYGGELRIRRQPPDAFALRRHEDRSAEKEAFRELLASLREQETP